jgi:hypothetical protein
MDPLQAALQKMGLTEMRLPRDDWPVGTIVAIKRDEWGNIREVPDVCNPLLMSPSLIKEGPGGSFIRTRTKDVSDLERSSTMGRAALSGAAVNDLKAGLGADGQLISGIDLGISQAWILYADGYTLSKTVDALTGDPRCAAEINKRRQKGYEVTALDQVLVANLTYTVSLSGKLSGEAEASLLKKVGAELKASYDQGKQTLIAGDGLTFGFSVPTLSPVPASLQPPVPANMAREGYPRPPSPLSNGR